MLLYNIVTSEMVLLEDSERGLFANLPADYCTEMDELIAHHYLVPEGFNENKSVRELRALLKKLEPSTRVTGFTILPTTECNARCYYCFESDHKRCTLTEKMADDVVVYMADQCKGEPIEISWFGGEPLVAHKRISQICAGLKQREIKFRSTMVSNAYLFDESLIQTAKSEWNLISVQITLDGTEAVYNETKAYVKPKDNPYLRVLKNILDLLDNGIAVNIRLNVTDKNYLDLSNLIDELADRFGEKKGFSCYSHAVYEGVGFEPLAYDDRNLIDEQTVELDAKLREKRLLGSLSGMPSLRVIHCMADNDSARLIYPDGTIGKCENKSSRECIGDIYGDITIPEMNEHYREVKVFPNCENCCFFPDCICLKICPETGTCSQAKVEWKRRRYTDSMKEILMKHRKECFDINSTESVLGSCES